MHIKIRLARNVVFLCVWILSHGTDVCLRKDRERSPPRSRCTCAEYPIAAICMELYLVQMTAPIRIIKTAGDASRKFSLIPPPFPVINQTPVRRRQPGLHMIYGPLEQKGVATLWRRAGRHGDAAAAILPLSVLYCGCSVFRALPYLGNVP